MEAKTAYFVWIFCDGTIVGKYYHGEDKQLKYHIDVVESTKDDFDFNLNNKYYKKPK